MRHRFGHAQGARVLLGLLLGLTAPMLQPAPVLAQAPVSLIALFNHATGTNPEVGAARAGVRAAGHGVIDSYIGFGPRVTATYDQQRERQNVMATQNPVYQTGKAYFGNQIGYGEAVQPVFDYRLFAQLKGAQAGERRESYLATAAEQKVIYSLVEAYLLALSANDSYALSQVEAKNLQSHQGEIKEKIKSGLANEGDLDEVEARYGLARARMIQAAAAVSEAFAAIERIAGIAAPALMPLKGAIPVPRPDPARPEDWVIAVLQGNPELLAANETITVARADFDKAIGGHLPRADLRATYNRSNTGGSLYGGGSNTDDMLLTLRVTVPIFNSQGQGLQFLQAKERERQAQLNWDVRRRELVQKTQTTYLEVVSNSERVKILSSAAAAQEKVAAGRRTKFQTGLTNITDVLDAEAASYRAKREYLAARYNYLLTMMQLKELAGAISPTDIGFIDSLLDPRQRPVRRIAL